jgi:sterol 22-desaturase
MSSFASFRPAAPSFSSGLTGKQAGLFGWNANKTFINPALKSQNGFAHKGTDAIRSLVMPSLKDTSPVQLVLTILAIIASLLILEQIMYRRKKAHLPGPKWTTPIVGKFLDSMKPDLAKYKLGWDSGPLSVASVFHMCV